MSLKKNNQSIQQKYKRTYIIMSFFSVKLLQRQMALQSCPPAALLLWVIAALLQ